MRRAFAGALVALASLTACTGNDPRPAPAFAPDAEADAHAREGTRLFVEAESKPDPRPGYAAALKEFEAAAAKVPSPRNRLAQARTAVLLRDREGKDLESQAPADLVDQALADAPEDASLLALRAFLDVAAGHEDKAAERATRACAIAAVTSERALRCFVGDESAAVASVVQRKDPVLATALMLAAADLGSPCALVNVARMVWLGRGVKLDRAKAIELAQKAAQLTFTPDEVASGLLSGEAAMARFAARVAGDMLVLETRFAEARPILEQGIASPDDATVPGEGDKRAPNVEFFSAIVELGALEAFGLGGKQDFARARERLEGAGQVGHAAALSVLGRIAIASKEDAKAREHFEAASRAGSLGAIAALGDWEKLATEARERAAKERPAPPKLYDLRTAFFALAVSKGKDARAEVEEAARAAAEGAPKNEPSARQLRHVAGDLSSEELQATMPKAALLARWRAETELALATRELLLGERDKARAHLEACRDAQAITQVEDELAWAALRSLK